MNGAGMTSLLAAALIGLAVWLVQMHDSRPRVRMTGLFGAPGALGALSGTTIRRARDRMVTPRRAGVIAGAAVAVLWWGVPGLVAGVSIALLLPPLLGRLESRERRRRRHDLARQAPVLADLLAATLASGAMPRSCVVAIAAAIGEPTAGVLQEVRAGLDLGADPTMAWGPLVREPSLASLGRSIIRSSDSGAPLAEVLTALADDQRRLLRSRAHAASRTAGVHAVAPLALCFLPAFIVVGIVPVVASLALTLWQSA